MAERVQSASPSAPSKTSTMRCEVSTLPAATAAGLGLLLLALVPAYASYPEGVLPWGDQGDGTYRATFTATVAGTATTDVTYTVNGVTGGNAQVGTITAVGLYTAPAAAGEARA